MEIELGKTYIARNGLIVRVIYIDGKFKNGASVVGLVMFDNNAESIALYYSGGRYLENTTSGYDLIEEYSFWNDVEIDTKIFVRDDENDNWQYAYFAGYKEDKVCVFTHGSTSWSNKGIRYWKYAKLAEKDKK